MSFATPGISSSSASSLIGESSNPQRKNKRYVKKKGETRKRNSMEINLQQQFVKESFQIDEISKKMENVTMNIESEAADSTITKKNVDTSKLKKLINVVGINGIKSVNGNDEDKEDVDDQCSAETTDDKDREMSLIIDKSGNNEEPKKDETNYKNLLKDFDKGKTEEEKKRDRQNARFAKAVARFSVKFTKAAIDLGIIRPNKNTASWSDSSSSSTDSCSSSCSCSDCCTTDSSTCSCSECRSSSSSWSSSFSSSPTTSCSTSNTSTSSNSSPTLTSSSSSSGIISPETFVVDVKKKFK